MREDMATKSTSPARPRSGWRTIGSLLPNLWPKGDVGSHVRVLLAIACLVLAKMATVYVPIIYSRAVDALAPKDHPDFVTVPIALIIAYGLLRVASSGFAELRDAVFAAVQQRTVRRVALSTFQHVHRLSLRFHLDRQTGGLSRAIARGTEAIEQVLRMAVFNILPTLFEVLLVTAVLWQIFDWRFAAVAFVAGFFFICFPPAVFRWRARVRRPLKDNDTKRD